MRKFEFLFKMRTLLGMTLFSIGIYMAGIQTIAAQEPEYDYKVTDSKYKVNPKDSKSDAKGIQDILDKAKGSEQMVTIYFPAGDYYVDQSLHVYSNTHLVLDDKAIVHRMKSLINKGILRNVDQNGKIDVVGGYKMSKNIIIEGGTWDGGNVQYATKGSDVMRFDHAENIKIKNCAVKNTYDCHLVELIGVKNGLIENCTFSGFHYKKGKEKNYHYAREAIQLETAWANDTSSAKAKEKTAWAKYTKIDGTVCKNITVNGNRFIDMPCGVGQHHYTKSGKYRNETITISNNEFRCSKSIKYCKTAITCSGMNDLTVVNNKISGAYRFAIHVIASDRVSVRENQIEKTKINGIMVDSGKTVSVVQNNVKNTGKHGISVSGGSVKEISENTIKNVQHNGICINKGKVTNITCNKIETTGKHGISVIGGTVGSGKTKDKGIQGNTISNCKQNGISVSGKAVVSSIGTNTISNVKNNGISLVGKAKVYWVVNNTIKKCKKHGISNGLSTVKVKIKGNKGKTK